MSNVKITDLTSASTPLAGTELFETVQGGSSKKVAASDIGNSADALPYNSLTGRAYCIAYNTGDVSFTADTATTIQFDTAGLEEGITVENDGGGDPTRITFAAAGTYEIAFHCQFANADNANHVGSIWFRLNGTDITYSASQVSVPKSTDGGVTFFQVQGILQVTAGQYVETVCAVANANVTLDYTAAQVSPYARPSIASALIVAQRIA